MRELLDYIESCEKILEMYHKTYEGIKSNEQRFKDDPDFIQSKSNVEGFITMYTISKDEAIHALRNHPEFVKVQNSLNNMNQSQALDKPIIK